MFCYIINLFCYRAVDSRKLTFADKSISSFEQDVVDRTSRFEGMHQSWQVGEEFAGVHSGTAGKLR